jgi:hypothetical protein
MRLYGGRMIKRYTDRRVKQGQELYNAVVMDVDTTNRYCRVKIQGSTTMIKAYYPENWEQTPFYLKPGNAVLLQMPGGLKGGRIEIAGHGQLLPTASDNSDIVPTPITPDDSVLTGCQIVASIPESMSIKILAGTFRINGSTYTITPISMDRTDLTMDRFDITMDCLDDILTLSAASASKYRYDSIVVGADGVIHAVSSTEFDRTTATIPDPPAAPADHVRLGYVLVRPSTTTITSGDINRAYSASSYYRISVSVADSDLSWAEDSTTISISMLDDNGLPVQKSDSGWCFTLSWQRGTGYLTYDGVTHPSTETSISIYYNGATAASATYTRDTGSTEESPVIFITEANSQYGSGVAGIQLYNVDGDKIP